MEKKIDLLLQRTPPHDLDAEEVLLSLLFVEKGAIFEVKKYLEADDFYKGAHKKIFQVIVDSGKDHADLVGVANDLSKKDELESIGGAAFLSALTDSVPLSFDIGTYVKIIFDCSIKRKIIIAHSEMIEKALLDNNSLDELMIEVETSFEGIKKEVARGTKTEKFEVSFDDLFGGSDKIIETPFPTLNDLIIGYGRKELTIIGGPQGSGKSGFCLRQLRHTVFEKGGKAIYCGAHMDEERVYLRIISQICGINFRQLLSGRPPRDKIQEVRKAYEMVYDNRSNIRHSIIPGSLDATQLETNVVSAIDEMGGDPDLLIIENLQQIKCPGSKFDLGSFKECNLAIERIKAWAQDLPPATLVSSQFTRKSMQRVDWVPELGDVLSDAAEGMAECVLFPHRFGEDSKGGPEKAELIIAKGGPTTSITMTFLGKSMNWEERY